MLSKSFFAKTLKDILKERQKGLILLQMR